MWRDRALLALVRWDLERAATAEADRRAALIETESIQDAAREVIATALAAIGDAARQTSLAARLATVPELTCNLTAAYHLLLALEGQPETLADFLSGFIVQHPDSQLVAEIARQLTPVDEAGWADAVRGILESPALLSSLGAKGQRKLARAGPALLADQAALLRLLSHTTVKALEEIGVLTAEDVPDALEALGAARIVAG